MKQTSSYIKYAIYLREDLNRLTLTEPVIEMLTQNFIYWYSNLDFVQPWEETETPAPAPVFTWTRGNDRVTLSPSHFNFYLLFNFGKGRNISPKQTFLCK